MVFRVLTSLFYGLTSWSRFSPHVTQCRTVKGVGVGKHFKKVSWPLNKKVISCIYILINWYSFLPRTTTFLTALKLDIHQLSVKVKKSNIQTEVSRTFLNKLRPWTEVATRFIFHLTHDKVFAPSPTHCKAITLYWISHNPPLPKVTEVALTNRFQYSKLALCFALFFVLLWTGNIIFQ